MVNDISNEFPGIKYPRPYLLHLLPATPEWDPAEQLKLRGERNPLADGTLGDVGQATRVTGPPEFPPTILIQPFDPRGLAGIDARSIRVFRFDARNRQLQPLWNSGINLEFGFIWAKIQQPGLYIPIGLPMDRFLRELLQTLALERRYVDVVRQEREDELTQRALAPFLQAPEEGLEELRQQLTLLEVQTRLDPFLFGEIRIGHNAAVQPFALPGDVSLDEFRERIARLVTPPGGLPEEALFFVPESRDEPIPPWPSPPGTMPERLIDPRIWERLRLADWIIDIRHPSLCFFFSRNWWMHHRDAQHTGRAVCSAITSTNVGTLSQQHKIALDGPVISIPTVVNGKIYVGTASSSAIASGGTLYRIDLTTGAIENQFMFTGVGSRQGQTGICSSPAVSGGKICFSGLNGKLYCLDANTFALLWVTDLRHTDLAHNQPVEHGVNAWGSEIRSNGWSSPLIVNNKVYVGFGEGESNAFGFVYCLDLNTGDVVWLFCTNQFTTGTDNSPNVIPPSSFSGTPPSPFTKATADPPQRGSSPWSPAAYDPVLNRVYIGTGNAIPDDPLPDPRYASGILSLDADTGQFRGFFQPAKSDSYRPDHDFDVDVPAGPTIFSRAGDYWTSGIRVVAFGSKNGSFFLLNADTMTVLARRQLLPYDSAGNPFPNVDPPDSPVLRENKSGMFGTAAVHSGLGKLYVGLGGYSGAIDHNTTPFIRALDWNSLADAWPTSGLNPPKYSAATPPVYLTAGETGLSSPAVVNDVVFISTTKPALYALDANTGLCLWAAPGISPAGGSYAFGPAIYGSYVVNGVSNGNLYIYSL